MLAKRISFIGFGRMGGALAAGAIRAGAVSRARVTAFDPDKAAIAAARRLKIRTARSESEAARAADIVFLCVKPQQMGATLDRLAELSPAELRKRCFVSIAAGISLERLQSALGSRVPVLRVMPNTPALVGAGASGISRGKAATAAHERQVVSILDAVGVTVSVPEGQMDAVTALSGSGPAYVFYLAEALAEAAVALGLKPVVARQLARQTIHGAGLMLRQREEDAAELRRQVTSPGGTTAAAIGVFDDRNLKALVAAALEAAARRSAELSRM